MLGGKYHGSRYLARISSDMRQGCNSLSGRTGKYARIPCKEGRDTLVHVTTCRGSSAAGPLAACQRVYMLTRKGLLCSLLQVGDSIRFFSSPEIASCHGAQRKMLFEIDDRQCMQKLGNALAVPQAAVTMAHAAGILLPECRVDPALVTSLSVNGRMTCANSALFQVEKGWLMVRLDEVGGLLARKHLRLDIERHMRSRGQVFHAVDIRTVVDGRPASDPLRVRFSSHVSVAQVLEALGTQAVGTGGATDVVPSSAACHSGRC